MLIAGHETTAAILTWVVYLLAQKPEKITKAQAEIDAVLGQGPPTYESMKKLEYIRLIVGDSSSLQCSSQELCCSIRFRTEGFFYDCCDACAVKRALCRAFNAEIQ